MYVGVRFQRIEGAKFLRLFKSRSALKIDENLLELLIGKLLATVELQLFLVVLFQLLNQKKWCQNEFQVANQITVEGRKQCRYDVTILINGLPLVQVELKKRGVELKQMRLRFGLSS